MGFIQAWFVHMCPEEIYATSARNIFRSSSHSKIVSNTSQTHPKYLISIDIIIWNEKRDFRTLSRGDNNHWCVGKENNRLENNIWHPLIAALMRHMLYKGWISNLLLFYSSSTSEIKSSSSSITAAWIWHSEEKFSEKKHLLFQGILTRQSHISKVSPTSPQLKSISNVVFSLTIENLKSSVCICLTFDLLGT